MAPAWTCGQRAVVLLASHFCARERLRSNTHIHMFVHSSQFRLIARGVPGCFSIPSLSCQSLLSPPPPAPTGGIGNKLVQGAVERGWAYLDSLQYGNTR